MRIDPYPGGGRRAPSATYEKMCTELAPDQRNPRILPKAKSMLGKFGWHIYGDGTRDLSQPPDKKIDINCTMYVLKTFHELCLPKPKWVDDKSDQYPGDENYTKSKVFKDAKKGDHFLLRPIAGVYLHTGFIATDVKWNEELQSGECQIYHSLQESRGPTEDTLRVRLQGDQYYADIVAPNGTLVATYKFEATFRARMACWCGSEGPEQWPPKLPSGRVRGMPRDPLVLNLDGNGVQTLGLNAGVYFDHDGNGFKELTGWVAPGNGVLMLDMNGSRHLDGGRELLGDFTILPNGMLAVNGFEALSQYDSNHDGRIDTNDPIWSQLKIWQDACSVPGIFHDPDVGGVISTLEELGIAVIYLNSEIVNRTDDEGNTEIRAGHFEWADGRSGGISEYRFQRDGSLTIPNEVLGVPPEIKALPELYGYGSVHDLHQAMVRDVSGQLKTLVENFASEASPANRATILDQIIFRWSGSDLVAPDARGPFLDGRKVIALERLYGTTIGNLDSWSASSWAAIYYQMFEFFYADLMGQTHLSELLGKITYINDDDAGECKQDFSEVIAELQTQLANDPEQGKLLLSEFARTMRGLGHDRVSCLPCREFFIMQDPELGWIVDSGGLPVIEPGPYWGHTLGTDNADAIKGSLTFGDGVLNGLNGNDVIYGTSRNEWLFNDAGDAMLVAGAGNDTIVAGAGNDILDGGEGNDSLYGEAGNDTYIFRRGSGRDTIIDPDATPDNVDTIWLGGNLTPADVILRRGGNNLVLRIKDTSETLTVQDFFKNDSTLNRIERIVFMDGTVWTDAELNAQAYAPLEGDDVIYGTPGDDALSGLEGNDTLCGLAGADTLHGDAGFDTLYGGADDDTLDGGTQNDVLDGGTGNDTYLFGRGSGQDEIVDYDATPGNTDTLKFGPGVLPTDIRVEWIGNDLKFTITDTGDSIAVKNWLDGSTPVNGIESVAFEDGTRSDPDTIKQRMLLRKSGDDLRFASPLSGRRDQARSGLSASPTQLCTTFFS